MPGTFVQWLRLNLAVSTAVTSLVVSITGFIIHATIEVTDLQNRVKSMEILANTDEIKITAVEKMADGNDRRIELLEAQLRWTTDHLSRQR